MSNSIVTKLKLNQYLNKTILNAPVPNDYFLELDQKDLETSLTKRNEDLIFAFVFSKEEMVETVLSITDTEAFNKNAYLYVAYPKIGNKNYSNSIHRDEIFPAFNIDPTKDGYLKGTSFKFARMVKLDDDFTIIGLKFLPKTDKKEGKKPSSQRVKDYVTHLTILQERLESSPKSLAFFSALTPGYQKGWARYIYSAKQEVTQQKRFEEMLTIFAAGFKSKELYQQRNH